MNLDLAQSGPDSRELLNKRRGPKPRPNQGISAVVPCKLNLLLIETGKTQSQLADDISGIPAYQRLMGRTILSRGSLALIASGRIIASGAMLAVLCHYLGCRPDELYEPYILALIDGKPSEWVKEGGYWE